MASSPSSEPTEIRRKGRQRLIGAIALVLLAVVFVPMVLDPEPRQERKEPSLAIPSKEGAPPLPAPSPASARPAAAPTAASTPAPAAEAAKVAVPAKPAADAPKLEGFAVQVGAFRDEEKLRQARERLVAAKIVHFTERLAAGDLTRLRAGPYATREDAEKARAAVAAAGLEGKVVTLP